MKIKKIQILTRIQNKKFNKKIEDNTIGGSGDANEDKNNVEQENEQES